MKGRLGRLLGIFEVSLSWKIIVNAQVTLFNAVENPASHPSGLVNSQNSCFVHIMSIKETVKSITVGFLFI